MAKKPTPAGQAINAMAATSLPDARLGMYSCGQLLSDLAEAESLDNRAAIQRRNAATCGAHTLRGGWYLQSAIGLEREAWGVRQRIANRPGVAHLQVLAGALWSLSWVRQEFESRRRADSMSKVELSAMPVEEFASVIVMPKRANRDSGYEQSFLSADLCAKLGGITTATLNKYAKAAGVETPAPGKKNHRYTQVGSEAICRYVSNTASDVDVVKGAREMLAELESKSKARN